MRPAFTYYIILPSQRLRTYTVIGNATAPKAAGSGIGVTSTSVSPKRSLSQAYHWHWPVI